MTEAGTINKQEYNYTIHHIDNRVEQFKAVDLDKVLVHVRKLANKGNVCKVKNHINQTVIDYTEFRQLKEKKWPT